jgi:thiamine-monophosphate kinase
MDEFALIDRYFAARRVDRADVKLGIGDDAAVASVPTGFDLVVATDSIVEGTHFPAGTAPRSLGYRCLAVNLSDLAAMGAEPMWCTLALSIPSAEPEWLQAFADGFFDLAERFDVALLGGDTVSGPMVITVTAHGRVGPGKYVNRSGAGPGQGIYITGRTGEARAGLQILTGLPVDDVESGDRLIRRFLYPDPRVAEGSAIANIATAMIDVSDGLHVDVQKLLRASQLGADLDASKVRLSHDLLACFSPREALELALTGGDDYELCFTVPAENEAEVEQLIAGSNCPISRIGETRSQLDIRWTHEGQLYSVPENSFRHF